MRFLLLGDFRQLPAVQDVSSTSSLRTSEAFLEWLRVGEAEQVELRDAVQGAQEFMRRGAGHVPGDLPRSQDRHQRAGEGGVARDAVVLEQALRWERFLLDDGQSFSGAELPAPACWGSRCGRVWLCDADNPHFSVKHLYVGASRATSAELVSVC